MKRMAPPDGNDGGKGEAKDGEGDDGADKVWLRDAQKVDGVGQAGINFGYVRTGPSELLLAFSVILG